MKRDYFSAEQGFSMIEILITLLVVAIALLGTAGLQAYALKMGQGGQLRTQAVFLAADMAERIEANKAFAAVNGAAGYEAVVAASVDCITNACTSGDLAISDVNNWNMAIQQLLPGGQGTISRAQNGNLYTYTVVVSWLDRRTDVTYSAAAAAAPSGASGGEDVTAAGGTRLSVTTSKTVRG